MGFCYHYVCREILKYAKRQNASLKGVIFPYIISFILLSCGYPQELCETEICFHSCFSVVCRQQWSYMTGNLQKAWRFKVWMGLSEFLRSANLMVSAYSVVLEAFPGEIPDGNRGIIWLQRAQAKICIQAPDRFKRGLKTQCMLAEHAQILLCMSDTHRFNGSSWGPHRKKNKVNSYTSKKEAFCRVLFFMILIHSTVQQFP